MPEVGKAPPSARRFFSGRAWPLQAYFALLVAVFLLVGGAAAAYVHIQTGRDARHTAALDARHAAQTAATQLGRAVALVRETVASLAANPQIGTLIDHPAGCSLTFSGLGAAGGRDHLDLLRPDGTVACSSRTHTTSGRLPGYAGAAWLAKAIAGSILLAPVVDTATGEWAVLATAPVPGHGIVAAFGDLTAAGPELVSLYGGGSPVVFLVVGRDGKTVVTRSLSPRRWIGTSLAGTAFARSENRVERRDLDGTPRFFEEAAVPGVGWRFFAGEDKAAALAAGSRLENRQLSIILVGLVAILAASLLVYRRLARPIEQLSAAVRSGSADARPETARALASVSGPAEVTALAEDIGGLIESIDDELLQRQRAEARTRELAAIVASSDDAILGKTLDGTITSWNVGAERMYGYTAEEAVGRSVSILLPPDQEDELPEILERIAAGRSVERFETVRRGKDGTLVDVSLTISPIEDAAGAIVGVSTIARDIGERKRAEKALRNSEAQYRLLFEGNPNAMWVYDAETLAFLAVNDAAVGTYGYTRDEFLAMTIEEIRPPDEIPRLREIVTQSERLGERGLNVAGIWKHRRKDGTILEVEVTSHPMLFEGRRARVALSIDVTQRRQAERDARESAARYQELVENASDLIVTVDLESRLTSVNRAFEVALGMSREELIGRSISELTPPEFHAKVVSAYGRKLEHETAETVYDHEFSAADGHRIAVEVASRVLVNDGQAIGIQAICRDVSERNRLEGQLRQAQKMEAVGQLAGGIAHDFNNILAAISMYGDLALRSKDAEKMHGIVHEIVDTVSRGASLTRQLLAFSRQQVLQPKVVDLSGALESLDRLLRRVLGDDIEFEATVEPQLGHVLVDPGQIEQVLMNLAVNAREAMPQGGRLRIEAANITVDAAYAAMRLGVEPGRYVRITVTDNGEGMDAETRERLFDPFFTTKEYGTGLGLATVYGIVKQSGAHISVYSNPGAGTTFRLLFPIVEAPLDAPALEGTVEAGDLTGTETILVVEDEQRVRELIEELLVGYGYTILAAGTPDEALQIAATWSEPIHLILSDVMLPGETGPQLVKKLQALHPEASCVFSSGYAHGHVGDRGLSPDQPFIAKPYSAVELVSTIRRTLDQ